MIIKILNNCDVELHWRHCTYTRYIQLQYKKSDWMFFHSSCFVYMYAYVQMYSLLINYPVKQLMFADHIACYEMPWNLAWRNLSSTVTVHGKWSLWLVCLHLASCITSHSLDASILLAPFQHLIIPLFSWQFGLFERSLATSTER